MDLLEVKDVKKIAKNAFKELESDFAEKDIAYINDVFFSLMKEEVNRNKDTFLQTVIVQDIVHDYILYRAQSSPQISFEQEEFKHMGDIKHLSYFDTFLENGASNDILKVLSKYNIPSSILKGLKPNIPFERTRVYPNVEIEQTISSGDDGSPTVDGFAIYYNGEQIYGFGELEFDENEDDDFEDEKKLEEIIKIAKSFLTKSGKQSKSRLLDTITFDYGDVKTTVRKVQLSNGQIRYIDYRGRFTKI